MKHSRGRIPAKAAVVALLTCFASANVEAHGVSTVDLTHFPRSEDHTHALVQSINEHHANALKDGDSSSLEPETAGVELELRLRDLAGALYAGTVCIGTPPQCMSVIMDTGSTNFLVATTDCVEATCLNAPARFDPSASTTFVKQPAHTDLRHFKVSFGTGKIHAALVSDRVVLGDVDSVSDVQDAMGGLALGQQVFGAVWSEEGAIFRQWKFSGILGLAMPEMAIFGHEPVFDHIMRNKQLDYDAFSFVLDHNKPRMELGMPHKALYTGEITWIPVIKTRYWSTALDDILVDGKSIGLCPSTGDCTAMFDSGTTLNTLPSKSLAGLLRAIGALKGNTDCDPNSTELKRVTYVLGGNNFQLEPKDFLLHSSTGGTSATESGGNYAHSCSAQFMSLDLPKDPSAHVLGEMFLRKYLVVFDRQERRIGVARKPERLRVPLAGVVREDPRVKDMLLQVEASAMS